MQSERLLHAAAPKKSSACKKPAWFSCPAPRYPFAPCMDQWAYNNNAPEQAGASLESMQQPYYWGFGAAAGGFGVVVAGLAAGAAPALTG
jgi:hypothetical protein